MWYGTSIGLLRYDGYQYRVFAHDPDNANTISDTFVTGLVEGDDGTIWVGTLSGGLNRFNPLDNTFKHYRSNKDDSTSLRDNYVISVSKDNEGRIWAVAKSFSLLDPNTGSFKHYQTGKGDAQEQRLFQDRENIFWAGSAGSGFYRFDPTTGNFKNYTITHPDPVVQTRSNVIRSITDDESGNIWMGTYGGLVRFNKKTEAITHWTHDDENPFSLSHNSIWSVEPAGDKIWIASWGGGVSYFDIKTGLFQNVTFQSGGLNFVDCMEFPSLYKDSDGTLWYGSNGKGIYKIKQSPGLKTVNNANGLLGKQIRFVKHAKRYTYFISDTDGLLAYTPKDGLAFRLPLSKEKDSRSVIGVRISDVAESESGIVYIGTDYGLSVYDTKTKKIKHFTNNPGDSTTLSHNAIMTTLIDAAGRLWLGTPSGLDMLEPGSTKFKRYQKKGIGNTSIVSLGTDENHLYVGSSRQGLFRLNFQTQAVEHFPYDPDNDSTLSNNYVSFIVQDSAKNTWVGTRSGLNKLRSDGHSFERYFLSKSTSGIVFAGDKVYLQAADGFYHVKKDSLHGALPRLITPETVSFERAWAASAGRFYIVADREIGYVELDEYQINVPKPPMAITQFSLDANNKHSLDSIQTRDPARIREITLDHDQNLFSLEYAALDYSNPAVNQYAYQLEGFDEGWTYSGTRRFVTYTNMDPGHYIFRVKGSNSIGDWNDVGASLAITILPPPWKTWWAYSLYVLVFILLLWWSRQIIVNRERLKAQVEINKKEKEALQELNQIKSKFFSNITHEFRTPLTLIQGPASELLERETDPEARRHIELIKSNATRLLKLINQLLDLSRLEAHEMKLHKEPVDLQVLVRTTAAQFTSHASSKNIQYTYEIASNLPVVNADGEKTEIILTNLISNALKFTPPGGRIDVRSDWVGNSLRLSVSDNGKGMPGEKLTYIFDRFYQVNPTDASHSEGTGIGLSLVKEYTELMRGTIDVKSMVDVGTTFIVTLPFQLTDNPLPSRIDVLTEEKSTIDQNGVTNEDKTKPLLLIVDDNEDIRSFIKSSLGNKFSYIEATHGKDGLDCAIKELPDIIISDLMMPVMDGVEFCDRIKKDTRTRHISFIMLTAKATEESKLEGLTTGADDYLVKPFNKSELLLKVKNRLTQQENLQQKIRNSILTTTTPIQAQSAEEELIVKARLFVESRMADEHLTVEALADELNLGREQCYRKIRALTGLSPSGFIRKIRLQRAAQLLEAGWGTVSQVAYEVGYENLSHFSKIFKEEFGKLPSEV